MSKIEARVSFSLSLFLVLQFDKTYICGNLISSLSFLILQETTVPMESTSGEMKFKCQKEKDYEKEN